MAWNFVSVKESCSKAFSNTVNFFASSGSKRSLSDGGGKADHRSHEASVERDSKRRATAPAVQQVRPALLRPPRWAPRPCLSPLTLTSLPSLIRKKIPAKRLPPSPKPVHTLPLSSPHAPSSPPPPSLDPVSPGPSPGPRLQHDEHALQQHHSMALLCYPRGDWLQARRGRHGLVVGPHVAGGTVRDPGPELYARNRGVTEVTK